MAEIPGTGGAPIPNPGPSTAYLQDLQNQYAGARAAVQGPSQPMVYLGADRVDSPIRGAGASFRDPEPSFTPRMSSLTQAMMDFEQLSSERKRKVAEKLAKAGLLGSPYKGESLKEYIARTPLSEVQNAYGDLLEAAAARYSAGQEVTPMQLLEQHIEYNTAAGSPFAGESDGGGGGGEGSPYAGKTITRTDTARDIYSRDEAEGLARAILRRELDRDPTDEEYEDFVAALQTKQRENPTITTTSTTYDEYGSPSGTSSTSQGGVDLERFAQNQAEDNPDWATWQAIGTFLPALFDELGAGVPGA